MKICLDVGRLRERFTVDERWPSGFVSRFAYEEFEGHAVPRSKSAVAPKDPNDVPLENDLARDS
jgi:hypothetical protein